MTDEGTLWVDYPSVGGPSPLIDIQTEPGNTRSFYRHSTWVDGQGWPWVNGSGLEGLTSISVGGLKTGSYTVRLHFAEPGKGPAGARVFSVALQGRPMIEHLDVVSEAGARLRGVVKEWRAIRVEGSLTVELAPEKGVPLLCGLELIADPLAAGPIPEIHRAARALLSRK